MKFVSLKGSKRRHDKFLGNVEDGYGFRADFTPSVLKWRKNDGKSYLKVKINMFLRPENEFTRLRTTLS